MKIPEKNKATVIIPSRFQSTRFPGKPLAEIDGKPLIYHCFHSITRSDWVKEVVVATDDPRIQAAVEEFGGKAVMTSSTPKTGTDRLAEAVEKMEGEVFVNVQGDEILLQPNFLDSLIESFAQNQAIQMATCKKEITDWEDLNNPNIVKVVCDREGVALYFSRSPIPFVRDRKPGQPVPIKTFFRHFGIYIYRKNFLRQFSQWPESFLENLEKLEQLRAMERGIKIWVKETTYDSLRIDIPEDLNRVKEFLERSHG
ncbi:MAG: 3-deoxy-manno-octulosonate cytidylyltransferase [Nitrospiria bacterium]